MSGVTGLRKHGHTAAGDGGTISYLSNPMTTQDDIIVGGAAGAPARLAKGTDGQVLTVDPTTHHLLWATPGTGMTNPMTTTGDIIYSSDNSGTPARRAVGAATTVLHGGTTPSYSAVLPADLDVSADNTTADATTGHHGLLPKLGGGTTNFLRADGTWAAPAGGGSFAPSYLGYNTIGASTENMTQFRVLMKKITLSTGQTIFNIGAHIKGDASDHVIGFQAAVLSDSSGSPLRVRAIGDNTLQSILTQSVTATPVDRWFDIAVVYNNDSGGSQDVWIAIMCTTATNQGVIYYDGSGSDRYYTSGGAWFADAGFYTVTTGSNKYSLRALVA